MLELSNKDFKAVNIKLLQKAIVNALQMNREIESLSKQIEVIKKTVT